MAAVAKIRARRARHSGSGRRRSREGWRTGKRGAGPESAPVIAIAAGVCGRQGTRPGERGVSRCRSWRCRRWWSTPWCCSVWWIISTGERAAYSGAGGAAAAESRARWGWRGGRGRPGIGKVGNQKRVVGVLLGSWQKKVLDVSNSFAVPFDEDDKDDSVWFLDHDYLENMYGMFKKVNARERIVGWYHTGPKLHKNDIAINELMKRYCPNSVLVIIDVKPKDLGLPTEAYISVEEVHDDGTPTSKTFEHVTSEIGAEEAEEVGVEHLLRDIKDTTVGTLSQRITNQVHGLKGLNSKLLDIRSYLEKVATGKLPINHQIIYQLQDVFNLLPDVSLQEFVKAFYLKTNDQMVVVYLASLIRSVVALHNLINNKIANRDAEKKEGQEKEDSKKDRKEDKEKDKDKEKSDVKKEEKKEKK
ncbi:26S proteasome non-ATPase regulatory subunit 7 isoform X1 [Papio anubis]|uniref:26S proteasome non-ATPase regulatory subunit 7 isoform X1 n=1 Tax=Papio anubis TaxID=9555 RepID=UPI000B7B0C2B|nr:26S proteasome non-ATPase regulatory subunit 7 isoform X1 [Papio anubis]